MSIERRRNTQKRSERTFMSIAPQRGRRCCVVRVRFSNPLGCCAVAARRAIKVLSDLSIMFLLMSIDIQVLWDLVRFRCCAAVAWRGAILLFILCILAILLQTKRAADKPPRSFMSIDAQLAE